MSRSIALATVVLLCAAGCSGSQTSADDSSEALTHGSALIKNFECTSIASSASDNHLRNTRLDITIDTTAAGVPTGMLLVGFEPSLRATSAVGFGTSHVRDTTDSGHHVSEYKISFGADSILPGATGGTLTLPTAYLHRALESSAALNVATLKLAPDATVRFKCKKDTRKVDNGPAPEPLVFDGAAKSVVASDACAKTVAESAMDQLVDGIEEAGVDVPDTFTFTKIDRTDSGYTMVVNGATLHAVVGAACHIESIDTASAVGLIGE